MTHDNHTKELADAIRTKISQEWVVGDVFVNRNDDGSCHSMPVTINDEEYYVEVYKVD